MSNACRKPAIARASAYALREADAATRPAVEAFIARRFAEVYKARLYHFMPRLFGLHGANGELLAAVGLRAADQQPLFLERYLNAPVEIYVAGRQARAVPRRRIVEVGNLAGAVAGALRELIARLCKYLHAQGFHWVAFTGSARLCNSFSRLGLPLHVIAPAAVGRLSPNERAHWGSYYDNSPAVMLGDISTGRRQLRASAKASRPRDLLAPLAYVRAP